MMHGLVFLYKVHLNICKETKDSGNSEETERRKGLWVNLGYFILFYGFQKYNSVVPGELQFTRAERRENRTSCLTVDQTISAHFCTHLVSQKFVKNVVNGQREH